MNFKEKNRAWLDVTGLLLFQWLHGRLSQSFNIKARLVQHGLKIKGKGDEGVAQG